MMINAYTCLYGILGKPVSHSLSPLMHNIAFSHIGWNGAYLAFEVKDLGAAITGIKALEIKGISVTIPHKIAVMEFLDELDEMAKNIGAVNTVVNHQGMLTGYNSDGLGAMAALSEKTSIREKNVAIIGAGGAARAIGFGICSERGNVTIVNRSADKGERLAEALGADFCSLSDIEKIKCDILINTTPLGMTPNTDSTPIQKRYLEKGMIVMDIVYNPLKTRLLKDAQEAGCVTIDGVAMFVYQGAFQFELWTGKKAPVEIMRKAVLMKLET
ncbi:shikimate dehydrogenase [Desulfonema magnum]|uniref:Shikimate dehydrogenase (NADP(+)) n=1 Tax=Desulfonema magnum TaxID=45655 RepID=A0A975BM71_9BACT|nr:shikimate dehydrogenase [Desulfonema magnum]QTA87738.1 Shikimate dehydrogenase [Desulfonema magnum]